MKHLKGGPDGSPQEQSSHQLQDKKSLLDTFLQTFITHISYIPKIGLELEFYLLEKDGSQLKNHTHLDAFMAKLSQLAKTHPLIYKIEKEQGIGQVEVKMLHHHDLLQICSNLHWIKKEVQALALKQELLASFNPQIFEDDCGSALQFNISLHDEKDENLFTQNSAILLSAITGLLLHTQAMMPLLAPKSQNQKRFDKQLNKNLHASGKYTAPVNLSYGANNRTCAIRILKKRLEYRVAGANCDPYLVMCELLTAMTQGIKGSLKPNDFGFCEIYGNAFDAQYELTDLPFKK